MLVPPLLSGFEAAAYMLLAVFQPCDVGLQRIFKHVIRQEASAFFVKEVQNQLAVGVPPEKLELSTSLPVLRNETPGWVAKAVDHLNAHPELVKKAWSNCRVGQFNLSWESLTSPAAFFAFSERSRAFQQEIKGEPICDDVLDPRLQEQQAEDAHDEAHEIEDEEDVPLEVLATAALAAPQPPKMGLPANPFVAAQLAATRRAQPQLAPAEPEKELDLPPGFNRSTRFGGQGAVRYREPIEDEDIFVEDDGAPVAESMDKFQEQRYFAGLGISI
jgi:hypothetical protein